MISASPLTSSCSIRSLVWTGGLNFKQKNRFFSEHGFQESFDDVGAADEGAQRAEDVGENDDQQDPGHAVFPHAFNGIDVFGQIFKIFDLRLACRGFDQTGEPAGGQQRIERGDRRRHKRREDRQRMTAGQQRADGGQRAVP